MTDFAPRDKFDIHAAIREANIKTAGLYGWPRIRSAIAPASVPPAEDSSAPATPHSLPLVAGAAAEGEGGR